MQLQGALGAATVTQTSRSHAHRHHSLHWSEATEGRGDGRPFDVRFDADAGLVRATMGRHDTATAPYVVAYRDPLSLVRELRALTAQLAGGAAVPTAPWHVPMLGKDVVVARVVEMVGRAARGAARGARLRAPSRRQRRGHRPGAPARAVAVRAARPRGGARGAARRGRRGADDAGPPGRAGGARAWQGRRRTQTPPPAAARPRPWLTDPPRGRTLRSTDPRTMATPTRWPGSPGSAAMAGRATPPSPRRCSRGGGGRSHPPSCTSSAPTARGRWPTFWPPWRRRRAIEPDASPRRTSRTCANGWRSTVSLRLGRTSCASSSAPARWQRRALGSSSGRSRGPSTPSPTPASTWRSSKPGSAPATTPRGRSRT